LAGIRLVFTKSQVNTRFESTQHIFGHFLEFSWGLTVISEITGKFQSSSMIVLVFSLFDSKVMLSGPYKKVGVGEIQNSQRELQCMCTKIRSKLCLTTRIPAKILPGHHVHTFTSMYEKVCVPRGTQFRSLLRETTKSKNSLGNHYKSKNC
jgi:hypothetical protein